MQLLDGAALRRCAVAAGAHAFAVFAVQDQALIYVAMYNIPDCILPG